MNKKTVGRSLAAALAGALLFSLAACAPSDTQTQPVQLNESEAPHTIDAIVEYFNAAANKVKTDRPKAEISTSVAIPEDGIQADQEKIARVFPIFRDQMTLGTSRSAERGSDLTQVAPVAGQTWGSRLPPSAVEWAVCTVSGEELQIVIKMKAAQNAQPLDDMLGTAFEIHDKQAVLNEINTKGADWIHVADYRTDYTQCYIRASVNGSTGEMLSAVYEKNLTVSAEVNFTGALADLGNPEVTMQVQEVLRASYTWVTPEDAAE